MNTRKKLCYRLPVGDSFTLVVTGSLEPTIPFSRPRVAIVEVETRVVSLQDGWMELDHVGTRTLHGRAPHTMKFGSSLAPNGTLVIDGGVDPDDPDAVAMAIALIGTMPRLPVAAVAAGAAWHDRLCLPVPKNRWVTTPPEMAVAATFRLVGQGREGGSAVTIEASARAVETPEARKTRESRGQRWIELEYVGTFTVDQDTGRPISARVSGYTKVMLVKLPFTLELRSRAAKAASHPAKPASTQRGRAESKTAHEGRTAPRRTSGPRTGGS
ncbi:MAG: hypothetical protein HY815_07425 [Candidatus Riflebacteria bacterium]|nr:hypothetical protein [Candidatus Riflebacteria bacterium]